MTTPPKKIGACIIFGYRDLILSGGGGVLAYKGLMGMCHWMGSLFHYCIGYNIMGLHFLIIELLE